MTALMMAAAAGRIENVEHLFQKEGNMVQNIGWTAIHFAATGGDKDVVDFLLKKETKHLFTKQKATPLMLAAERGHFELVKILKG